MLANKRVDRSIQDVKGGQRDEKAKGRAHLNDFVSPKGGSMQMKHYKIKIYQCHNNEWQQVAEYPVSLTDPPKIHKSAGKDTWFDKNRETIEKIEKTLETELKTEGVGGILKHYKPLTPQCPVTGKIIDDFSWTIEEDF